MLDSEQENRLECFLLNGYIKDFSCFCITVSQQIQKCSFLLLLLTNFVLQFGATGGLFLGSELKVFFTVFGEVCVGVCVRDAALPIHPCF